MLLDEHNMATPANQAAPPAHPPPPATHLHELAALISRLHSDLQILLIESLSFKEQMKVAAICGELHNHWEVLRKVADLNASSLFDGRQRSSVVIYNVILKHESFAAERRHAQDRGISTQERTHIMTRSLERNRDTDRPSLEAKRAISVSTSDERTWQEIISQLRPGASRLAIDLSRECDEYKRWVASKKPQWLLNVLLDFVTTREHFGSDYRNYCSGCFIKRLSGQRGIRGEGSYCATCRPAELDRQMIRTLSHFRLSALVDD